MRLMLIARVRRCHCVPRFSGGTEIEVTETVNEAKLKGGSKRQQRRNELDSPIKRRSDLDNKPTVYPNRVESAS